MGRLTENQVFTLKVKELEPSFDSYNSNQGTGKMFCHRFIMVDDTDVEFVCQWCNESPTVTEYKVGDILKIQTKKFVKNIQNMVPLSKVEFVKPGPPEQRYEPINSNGVKSGEPVASYPNPQIAGTMIDRAMTNAVLYYKDNEVPFEHVTEMADQMLDWYKKQLKNL